MRIYLSLCALVCALLAVSCAQRSTPLPPQAEGTGVAAGLFSDPTSLSPTSTSPYTYAGCPIFTYNDWFTTNLLTGGSSYVSATIDPNSSTILSDYRSAMGGSVRFSINGTTSSVSLNTPVNIASDSTPLTGVTSSSCAYGCLDDAYNDEGNSIAAACFGSCAWKIRWRSGFAEQGMCSNGDCRDEVVNTQTCVAYETYTSGHRAYNGSKFNIEFGAVHSLRHSWDSQRNGGPDGAGVPLMGTMLWGEDASLPAINHIIGVSIAGQGGSPAGAGGWVKPATHGHHCHSWCSHPLPMGARLRLNRSKYTCPSATTHPQAHKICIAMETYGIIVLDWNGTSDAFGPGLQPTRSGSNPWHETDVYALNGIPITDFDIMKMGAYTP